MTVNGLSRDSNSNIYNTATIAVKAVTLPVEEDSMTKWCHYINFFVKHSGGIVTFSHNYIDYQVRSVEKFSDKHLKVSYDSLDGTPSSCYVLRWTRFCLFPGGV